MTYQLRGRHENSDNGRTPGITNPGSFWELNPDAIPRLLELREQLLSTRQMGMILGCSRNSIIGKLARLGLPSLHWGAHSRARAYDATPERVKRKLRLVPPDGQKRPYTRNSGRTGGNSNLSAAKLPTSDERLLRPACKVKGSKSILSLKNNECRFSVGFDNQGTYLFCSGKTDGSSWCPKHADRVFKKHG